MKLASEKEKKSLHVRALILNRLAVAMQQTLQHPTAHRTQRTCEHTLF